jgi:hypothetical protein
MKTSNFDVKTSIFDMKTSNFDMKTSIFGFKVSVFKAQMPFFYEKICIIDTCQFFEKKKKAVFSHKNLISDFKI